MASKLNRIGKDIMSAMKNATEQGTSAYDTTAEVRRIEGDIAWVHIAGGVDETPVKLTIAAKAGDSVQVRVGGGRAWITGNATAPPTDDRQANIATEKAEFADTKVVIAQETADTAKKIADTAKEIAGDTNQYFWHTQEGTDTGAHITEKPQEEFLDDPQHGGGNLLMRSNGLAVRDGLTELATFGSNSAQVGAEGTAHLSLDVRGLYIADELNQDEFSVHDIAKDHTEAVVDTFVGDGVTNSFLLKYPVDTISGQLSVTVNDVFSTWVSTVAPSGGIVLSLPSTPASGAVIKATYYVASGYMYALSLGTRTGKPNSGSAAIGNRNEASGRNSVALNSKTVSASDSQTAIGVLNERDDENKYAFLIGNGSDESHRSNALTVDWDGEVWHSGDGLHNVANIIMTSKGTLSGASVAVYGKVAQLNITFKNTTAQATNATVYSGTISDYKPKQVVNGFGSISGRPLIGTLNAAGAIDIRNLHTASLAVSSDTRITFTYILA